MRFVDFPDLSPAQRHACVRVLTEAFAHMPVAVDGAFAVEVDTRKQGCEVVGLIPDAKGPGKPDIFMAKKL